MNAVGSVESRLEKDISTDAALASQFGVTIERYRTVRREAWVVNNRWFPLVPTFQDLSRHLKSRPPLPPHTDLKDHPGRFTHSSVSIEPTVFRNGKPVDSTKMAKFIQRRYGEHCSVTASQDKQQLYLISEYIQDDIGISSQHND